MSLSAWLYPPKLEQEDQTRLARNLHTILVSLFVFEVIFSLVVPFAFPDNAPIVFTFQGITMALTIGCYILMQRGYLKLASLIFCFLFGLITLVAVFLSNGLDSINLQLFILVILFAGLLLGARYSLFFAGMGVATILGLYLIQMTGWFAFPVVTIPIVLKIALPTIVYLMAGVLLAAVSQNTFIALSQSKEHETALVKANTELKAIQTNLEQRIEERTAQLQASIELSQTISNLRDADPLGQQVVQKLSSLFGYDIAAIYFLDNSEQRVMLRYTNIPLAIETERQPIDLQKAPLLSEAIRTRKPRFANYTTPLSYAPITHLAPQIGTEIILPLLVRGQALGAISLQRRQTLPPQAREITILQSLANQIAAAFENTRLFNESQQQLQEINRLNQFYLQTTWRALLAQEIPSYHFSMGTITEMETPNEPALEIAQQQGKISIKNENGNSTLIAPIMFQNQVLGALELTAPNRTWSADEIIMIESVVNQTALSLENTRLMLETRNRAEQEKMVGEISSRFRETLDLETILQTSVQEMQKSLKLAEVEIRLLPTALQDTSELRVTGT